MISLYETKCKALEEILQGRGGKGALKRLAK